MCVGGWLEKSRDDDASEQIEYIELWSARYIIVLYLFESRKIKQNVSWYPLGLVINKWIDMDRLGAHSGNHK